MKFITFFILISLTTSCSSLRKKSKKKVKRTIITMVNAIDSKDWSSAVAQFDTDVFVDYQSLSGQPGSKVLSKDLVGNWEKLLKKVNTHHMLTNFEIKTNGEEAESFSHVYASHTAKGLKYWDAFGRYHHKLRKTKDGWKITFMKLIMHGQKGNKNFLKEVGKK